MWLVGPLGRLQQLIYFRNNISDNATNPEFLLKREKTTIINPLPRLKEKAGSSRCSRKPILGELSGHPQSHETHPHGPAQPRVTCVCQRKGPRHPGVRTPALSIPAQRSPPFLFASQVSTGFCLLLFNGLSVSLARPSPPFSSIPAPLIPSSLRPAPPPTPPRPQAKQCSEYHITQKEQTRNTQTSLSLYTRLLKRTRVNGTCPSILEEENRNPSDPPTQQRKIPPRKNVSCLLYIFGV